MTGPARRSASCLLRRRPLPSPRRRGRAGRDRLGGRHPDLHGQRSPPAGPPEPPRGRRPRTPRRKRPGSPATSKSGRSPRPHRPGDDRMDGRVQAPGTAGNGFSGEDPSCLDRRRTARARRSRTSSPRRRQADRPGIDATLAAISPYSLRQVAPLAPTARSATRR